MKKVLLSLMILVGISYAETCVLKLEVQDPANETSYSVSTLCIDTDLYEATFRPDQKDFVNVTPSLVYRNGVVSQKKCICPKYELIDEKK